MLALFLSFKKVLKKFIKSVDKTQKIVYNKNVKTKEVDND